MVGFDTGCDKARRTVANIDLDNAGRSTAASQMSKTETKTMQKRTALKSVIGLEGDRGLYEAVIGRATTEMKMNAVQRIPRL